MYTFLLPLRVQFLGYRVRIRLALAQWFSRIHMNQITRRACSTTDLWDSPGVSDSVGLGWTPRMCLSSTFPGDGDAAGLETTL